MKNPNSPGFPKTAEEAIAYARYIKAARSERTPWRDIAEQLAISRIEAIRLSHSLDDVLEEINGHPSQSPPMRVESQSGSEGPGLIGASWTVPVRPAPHHVRGEATDVQAFAGDSPARF